jgi:uncharacterized repeat protein (TIGR03837 family)
VKADQLPPNPQPPVLRWDIVCQVVDNWGDLGVCWRLACDLAARGQSVRLWVDDAAALQWMAPTGCPGVALRHWPPRAGDEPVGALGDVVLEAFGTENATNFIAANVENTPATGQFGLESGLQSTTEPLWINLEYLSAEPYVERSHRLPSPILQGPAAGHTRWFFYPGFTPSTGGLLRESNLPARQAEFSRQAWLAQLGLAPAAEDERFISLFCYESPALPTLLQQLSQGAHPSRLLVTHGRAAQAVKNCLQAGNLSRIGIIPAYYLDSLLSNAEHFDSVQWGPLRLHFLPPLTQVNFDHLLWACDFNIVRGEDSLVRALWAGKPFLWHIYPQSDGVHTVKLQAFLDWLQAPPAWRQACLAFNGMNNTALGILQTQAWQACITQAKTKLLAQLSLSEQLLDFVQEKFAGNALATIHKK